MKQSLLVAALIALALSACGKNEEEAPAAPVEQSAPEVAPEAAPAVEPAPAVDASAPAADASAPAADASAPAAPQ